MSVLLRSLEMTTIIVSGAIANKYRNGGEAWVRLSWALGLQRLGFRVYFVEQIGHAACVDATGASAAFEDCVNLAYFKQIIDQFGLSGSAALIYENGEQIHGMAYAELLEIAAAADLLVNISGHLCLEPLVRRLRRKAYVDLDPGFTQFWHAAGNAGARLAGHDFYFTVGENIGTPSCPIPTGDIRWRPTRQPVVLEHWPVSEGAANRFTSVASWRGPYGPVEHAGRTYGLKVHEWRKFVELPERAPQVFEIALDIHPADEKDMRLLRSHGWRIVAPRAIAPDPNAFRRYVQASGAEFSVAQGIYVETESGWFSDRTVRYLASGKPVLVQDTGFSRNLPTGQGLVSFRTLEQAIDGASRIARDYEEHCQAARGIAEMYFDSDLVLGRLIEEVGLAP
jgi:hypothetical protein